MKLRTKNVEVYVPGFHPIWVLRLFIRALRASRSQATVEQFAAAARNQGWSSVKLTRNGKRIGGDE